MKILITLLLTTMLFGTVKTVEDYHGTLSILTYEQKVILIKSYSLGVVEDYGYTLAAIAWKESNLGLYKMNLIDGDKYKYKGSFGIYHILLNTAMARNKHNGNWTASRTAEKLYDDIKYSSDMALKELLFWENTWTKKNKDRVYSRTIASYNAGYKSLDSEAGKAYSDDIRTRIKAIKLYFKEYRINEILK